MKKKPILIAGLFAAPTRAALVEWAFRQPEIYDLQRILVFACGISVIEL